MFAYTNVLYNDCAEGLSKAQQAVYSFGLASSNLVVTDWDYLTRTS